MPRTTIGDATCQPQVDDPLAYTHNGFGMVLPGVNRAHTAHRHQVVWERPRFYSGSPAAEAGQ